MPLAPKAIRVKTAAGWQDIALQGPPGPVAQVPIEAWHTFGAAGEPAFQTGWLNYGAPHSAAGFRRRPDGRVEFRGLIKSGTSGSVAFTLPVGYRPTENLLLSTNGNNAAAVLSVRAADGVCIPTGSNVYFQLDGLEFPTDQATFPAGAPVLTPVSTLPVSPTDGQEILFQTSAMATDGIAWRLRYRSGSASAYKWEFVGGPSLHGEVVTSAAENITSTASYVNATTPGPTVTLPLAGDYDIETSMVCYHSTTGALCAMSYDIGATPAVHADAAANYQITGGIVNVNPPRRVRRKTLPAGALTAKYITNQGTLYLLGTAGAAGAHRLIRATPVRVG